MRSWRWRLCSFLLLAPALSLSAALDTQLEQQSAEIFGRDAPTSDSSVVDDVSAATRPEVGTRDGTDDGKPHAGPFVEVSSGKDKLAAVVQDLGPGKATPTSLERYIKEVSKDGGQIPESNDGVMDDKYRITPKEGTTGTEGGVSEKNRIAQEGQTGAKLERVPDPPKIAPPLPHSEEEEISKENLGSGKDGVSSETDKKRTGAKGLEVRYLIASSCDDKAALATDNSSPPSIETNRSS